jgi:hypothetical protein
MRTIETPKTDNESYVISFPPEGDVEVVSASMARALEQENTRLRSLLKQASRHVPWHVTTSGPWEMDSDNLLIDAIVDALEDKP